uniref:cinnamyl-alcohol dehydrogenase n=1 Tax=Leersia perrieri TaxID=77586 RepID=A0A0D9XDH6_9ORYZ
MENGSPALGWAARDTSGHLSPYSFKRRVQKDDDVTIKVLFCGICHTDLHIIKNEWGNALYPVVPGHEIVGVVTDVGAAVTKFNAGDTVGVGYFVDSCRSCDSCEKGNENYCPTLVITSNGVDYSGDTTRGGFSDSIVVNDDYVIRVPASLPPSGAAPLLCAGVTVYTPMRMMDFAGEHGIAADVEVVAMGDVNEAVDRLERNDVRYRFVVDVAGTLHASAAAAAQKAHPNLGFGYYLRRNLAHTFHDS